MPSLFPGGFARPPVLTPSTELVEPKQEGELPEAEQTQEILVRHLLLEQPAESLYSPAQAQVSGS